MVASRSLMLSSFFWVAVSFSMKRAFRASYYSCGTTVFYLSFCVYGAWRVLLFIRGDCTTSKLFSFRPSLAGSFNSSKF